MIVELLPLVAAEERREKEPSVYYPRPSQAGPERCLRQLVYFGLDFPAAPLPGRAILTMDDSSWHEELTADWINKTAYKLHSRQIAVNIDDTGLEIPAMKCAMCKADIPANVMHGHADYIVTDPMGRDYLLEHKAINHFTWQRYAEGKTIPMDYITQGCLYLRGLLKIQPEMTDAFLIVKNKNTAQYFELPIHYDAVADTAIIGQMVLSTGKRVPVDRALIGITNYAIVKFGVVAGYLAKRTADSVTLPDRQYNYYEGDWQCEYCAYGATCYEHYAAEIEAFSKDAALNAEIITAAKYYCELNGHMSEMEKEKKAAKSRLRDLLKQAKIASGKAEGYSISLKLQRREPFTVAAKTIEVLTVRKLNKEAVYV